MIKTEILNKIINIYNSFLKYHLYDSIRKEI